MRAMPAWRTSSPRLWRRIGEHATSWRNRHNAARTRSPASGARQACSPPGPRGRTNYNRHPQLFRERTRRLPSSPRICRTAAERRGDATGSDKLRGAIPISAGIPGFNLHFYWVFVRSNISCGRCRSWPQYVVNLRESGRIADCSARLAAGAPPNIASFVLSPQSVGIMAPAWSGDSLRWSPAMGQGGTGGLKLVRKPGRPMLGDST
jgi:hypothetical protein